MTSLSVHEFGAFFAALHGHDPFPWQTRLAHRVADGTWPSAIALPTGAGKTACIDVALFALALQVGLGDRRSAARRIAFVVDRRVVVDEAHERARRIAEQLASATDGVLARVAERLRAYASGPSPRPLEVALLRGGIVRDETWAQAPDVPTVILSTVDQVGSRLLFRGYGMNPSGNGPIHTGVLGSDVLYLVDEAHIAQPFAETLQAVARFRAQAECELRTPFAVTFMTATPLAEGERFEAGADDREHPVLGPRLTTKKLARLERTGNGDIAFAAAVAKCARSLRTPDAPVVGVIVNRVRTANEVASRLPSGDTVVLTGRMRPHDRRNALERVMRAARVGALDRAPLFVVATQTIEVGADLDFDALVTEIASLPALRQRFGRLDRVARLGTSPAVVLTRERDVKPKADDPVYGPSMAATWAWLDSIANDGVVDFGAAAMDTALAALRDRDPVRAASLAPATEHAPTMLPAHCDAWVQTAPVPGVDPDVAPFLHGLRESSRDVSVIWRWDVEALAVSGETDLLVDALNALPPTADEAMPVPIGAVRTWMSGADAPAAGTDLLVDDAESGGDGSGTRTVVRWSGPDDVELLTTARQLRPGDTLLLAVGTDTWRAWGTLGGDDPSRVDIAEIVAPSAAGSTTAGVRLHPARPDAPTGEAAAVWSGVLRVLEDVELRNDEAEVGVALDALEHQSRGTPLGEALACVRSTGRAQLVFYPDGRGAILHDPRSRKPAWREQRDQLSRLGVEVRLERHLADVGRRAIELARACGLPDAVAADLGLAGRLHDIGKLDPRFQAWLRDGAAAPDDAPLAKSAMPPTGRAARELARQRSAYPRGLRHEMVSFRIAEQLDVVRDEARDPDLVLHLVASHHGHARPFAPPVVDPEPVQIRGVWERTNVATSSEAYAYRLDSGVAVRFWRLVRRYGWWGLTWLEAVFRLADHQVSRREAGEERA